MTKRAPDTTTRAPQRRRRERRPFVPAGTLTRPVEHTEIAADPSGVVGPPHGRKALRTVRGTFGAPLPADYGYVASDLRKIIMTAGGLLLVMFALTLVVR